MSDRERTLSALYPDEGQWDWTGFTRTEPAVFEIVIEPKFTGRTDIVLTQMIADPPRNPDAVRKITRSIRTKPSGKNRDEIKKRRKQRSRA